MNSLKKISLKWGFNISRKILILSIFLIITISFSFITQSQNLLDYYIVIKSYYANPFSIDLSSMPKLSSLPINQWIVIGLPSPAVAGDGSPTFILVNRGTTNNLLIYLEGGGACYSYTTCNPNSPLRSLTSLYKTY